MTGVEELRAVAAIVLAVSLPIAFVLLAISRIAREPSPGAAGPTPLGAPAAASGAAIPGRLLGWAGGLSLASAAVLLLLW